MDLKYSTQDIEFQIEELPALPGRQVQRILRRQHLPADHRALDYFDPGAPPTAVPTWPRRWRAGQVPAGELHHRLALRAPARSREIVKALLDNRRDVSYAEIDAPHGHDAFCSMTPRYMGVMRSYFDSIAKEFA